MTDLIEYIETIGKSYGITDPDFTFNVSKFLVSNNWFGCHRLQAIISSCWRMILLRKSEIMLLCSANCIILTKVAKPNI